MSDYKYLLSEGFEPATCLLETRMPPQRQWFIRFPALTAFIEFQFIWGKLQCVGLLDSILPDSEQCFTASCNVQEWCDREKYKVHLRTFQECTVMWWLWITRSMSEIYLVFMHNSTFSVQIFKHWIFTWSSRVTQLLLPMDLNHIHIPVFSKLPAT